MAAGNNGGSRTREKGNSRGNNSYQTGRREGNSNNRNNGSKQGYGDNRQRNADRNSFNKSGNGNGRPQKKFSGTGRGYGTYDKDRNEDTKRDNRHKSSQGRDSKVKEQQPDKMEIISRIEKEKKAVQKKQAERKNNNKANRQQSRPKRMGNIDWTKAYENDSYDDDDFDLYL